MFGPIPILILCLLQTFIAFSLHSQERPGENCTEKPPHTGTATRLLEDTVTVFSEGTADDFESDLNLYMEQFIEEKGRLGVQKKMIEMVLREYVNFIKIHDSKLAHHSLSEIFHFVTAEEREINNEKPRVEVRSFPKGKSPRTPLNLALALSQGAERDNFYKHLLAKFHADKLDVRMLQSAGSTTVEIGDVGVDKGNVVRYISNYFPAMVSPGVGRDDDEEEKVPTTPTTSVAAPVLISDADGTLWKKPQADLHPEFFDLSNSPVLTPLKKFLSPSGTAGYLVINSGNDPQRVINRLLPRTFYNPKTGTTEEREGLSPEELQRVFVAAAGGHILLGFRPRTGAGAGAGASADLGPLEVYEVEDYRLKGVLPESSHPSDHSDGAGTGSSSPIKGASAPATLDFIYVGDDARTHGNDLPGCAAAGFNKCVILSQQEVDPASKASKIPDSKSFDRRLVAAHVPGEEYGMANLLSAINTQVEIRKSSDKAALTSQASPVFGQLEQLVAQANTYSVRQRYCINKNITQQAISFLSLLDREINNPRFYTAHDMQVRTQAYHNLHGDGSTSPLYNTPEELTKSKVEEIQTKINTYFAGQPSENLGLGRSLAAASTPKDENLARQEQVTAALSLMEVQDGEVIRILVPGNNDRGNALHVAQMIKEIRENLEHKGRKGVEIQVLVMGKGGYPTTAEHRNFGRFTSDAGKNVFHGMEEAEILGHALQEELHRLAQTPVTLQKTFETGFFRGDLSGSGGGASSGGVDAGTSHSGGDAGGGAGSGPSEIPIKIMQEPQSTSTKDNVQKGKSAGPIVRNVIVAAATTGAGRQGDTFLYGLQDERGAPLYQNLAVLPPPRSLESLKSLPPRLLVYHYLNGIKELIGRFAYQIQRDKSEGSTYRSSTSLGIFPFSPVIPPAQAYDYINNYLAQLQSCEGKRYPPEDSALVDGTPLQRLGNFLNPMLSDLKLTIPFASTPLSREQLSSTLHEETKRKKLRKKIMHKKQRALRKIRDLRKMSK